MEFIDVSAKTIEDAIAKGVAQLAAEGQERTAQQAAAFVKAYREAVQ